MLALRSSFPLLFTVIPVCFRSSIEHDLKELWRELFQKEYFLLSSAVCSVNESYFNCAAAIG